MRKINLWWDRGLNPGPLTQKSDTLLLDQEVTRIVMVSSDSSEESKKPGFSPSFSKSLAINTPSGGRLLNLDHATQFVRICKASLLWRAHKVLAGIITHQVTTRLRMPILYQQLSVSSRNRRQKTNWGSIVRNVIRDAAHCLSSNTSSKGDTVELILSPKSYERNYIKTGSQFQGTDPFYSAERRRRKLCTICNGEEQHPWSLSRQIYHLAG
uniref:Uncharacterized protein n=1 Tax=Timema douglasi TaxID=61478 RepID=A0A7R8VVG9_TIMDO|nr:unnamed protein product [Timema douglasi]